MSIPTGPPVIVILDRQCVPHPYEVLPGPAGVLRLRHAEKGAVYTLSRGTRRWECDCPAATRRGPRPCKHSTTLDELGEIPMPPAKPAPAAPDMQALAQALAAPFPDDLLGWKAQAVSGNRCLAVPFIDARDVAERLDAVLGLDGWVDTYERGPDGVVLCRLSLRLCGEWVTKQDVGGQSDQPDAGDRAKSAFSDALKRAAVKFGVGRYLYRMEPVWTDYDRNRKRIVGKVPCGKPEGHPLPDEPPADPRQSPGGKLLRQLGVKEQSLVQEGLCEVNALINAVRSEGRARRLPDNIADWPAGQRREWVDEFVTRFEAGRIRERDRHAAPAGR